MSHRQENLTNGHRYGFICLQIDIAGHSKLTDPERHLHTAKARFHDQITGLVVTYGGKPFKWEGDGGAFLFPVTDASEFDEAVYAAFRILSSLPTINEELQQTTGLTESLSVRISLDAGEAVYDDNPGLITGDFLNAFLKNERAISQIDAVTVTERVYRQVSQALRERFTGPIDSRELGCRIHRANNLDSKAALTPNAAVGESASRPEQPLHVPSEGQAIPPPKALMDRLALVEALQQLTPSDFASVVARIPEAARQISRHGTISEKAAELIHWAESMSGPGLPVIEAAFRRLRP